MPAATVKRRAIGSLPPIYYKAAILPYGTVKTALKRCDNAKLEELRKEARDLRTTDPAERNELAKQMVQPCNFTEEFPLTFSPRVADDSSEFNPTPLPCGDYRGRNNRRILTRQQMIDLTQDRSRSPDHRQGNDPHWRDRSINPGTLPSEQQLTDAILEALPAVAHRQHVSTIQDCSDFAISDIKALSALVEQVVEAMFPTTETFVTDAPLTIVQRYDDVTMQKAHCHAYQPVYCGITLNYEQQAIAFTSKDKQSAGVSQKHVDPGRDLKVHASPEEPLLVSAAITRSSSICRNARTPSFPKIHG
ncbi:hypothetical protein FLAG1_00512 [Fusarium langsethiae]|uniref:Uncharacterized protein n=1 Tax=Fusarium langsethiae TaxID=179993 RepID=A0A0M9F5R0_FUSLA|nr:hypothetical protein FLAG1_00512 [Fusarium langsethiae]GKT98401.1 unnamed protein product [Fusarium langsethiae]GKU18771.1 unnamed protein product [Fusarium langsethiae]